MWIVNKKAGHRKSVYDPAARAVVGCTELASAANNQKYTCNSEK